MPTREEKVIQVETALRQRFYTSVPKVVTPERISWSEEQHDTDRLSRALAAYALVGLCDIDDATAASAITDGKNDGGIDALYFDRPVNRLVFIQAKFKRTGTAPSQEEVLKTINGIKALQERRFDEFNEAFRNRLDEIEGALDTAGVKIYLVLVFLGDNLGVHVINDLNALKAEMNRLIERMMWQHAGVAAIYDWLLAEETPTSVNAQVILENWGAITVPRKAVYGQITADALAHLVERYGKALFERNIRHYLGSVGVNTAIEDTVRHRPGDFFYLNNGITAVAESITQAVGTTSRCAFGVSNISIVNGAQTAGAIATAAVSGALSPDAKLLITIIEVGTPVDDISLRITRARNHQNVVRGVDFAALDPNQERLRQQLALVGITYYYRPSAEARTRREDAFTLEEAAVALACLSIPILSHTSQQELRSQGRSTFNAVDCVVTAKKEIGRLWDQEGTYYRQLFPATVSGLRICRCVHVYRFIDKILADTERSEGTYSRRMFFRHGRYFIMACVAHRSGDIIRRPELALSVAGQTLLSQRTNELAELIYAQSQPLLADKGYLSIFRNLTDSQSLADGVLQRLAQQDGSPPLPSAERANEHVSSPTQQPPGTSCA